MSDDLVERLVSLADCDARAGEPLGKCMREAAAHIEELEERLKAAQDDAKEAEAYAGELESVLESIKAKLVKAVEGLMFYADKDKWIREVPYLGSEADADSGDKARATLAELTGGKDE